MANSVLSGNFPLLRRHQLEIINIRKPSGEFYLISNSDFDNSTIIETWSNRLVMNAMKLIESSRRYNNYANMGFIRVLCAPDYNGCTDGDTEGINILIETYDRSFWQSCADALGAKLESAPVAVEPGMYGSHTTVNLYGDGAAFVWVE